MLEALDDELAALQKPGNRLKKHGHGHCGQQLRRSPLIPAHYTVFDVMHGVHCEVNVLLDESVHKHLAVAQTTTDKQVKATCETAQAAINAEWKAAGLPKFIQFGHDETGAHSHALNGPTAEAVMDRPSLIISTIKHMQPVYELLETRKQTPPLEPEAVGMGL